MIQKNSRLTVWKMNSISSLCAGQEESLSRWANRWTISQDALLYFRIQMYQSKVTFSAFDYSFIPHPAKFLWHICPFKIQIIRKLLSVERNVKLQRMLLLWHGIQICQQPAAAALRRGMETSSRKDQVFVGWNQEKVFQDLFLPWSWSSAFI